MIAKKNWALTALVCLGLSYMAPIFADEMESSSTTVKDNGLGTNETHSATSTTSVGGGAAVKSDVSRTDISAPGAASSTVKSSTTKVVAPAPATTIQSTHTQTRNY